VTLFGGEEGFKLTQFRDEKKRALLARHGVRLLEWRFDVRITRAELIAQMAAMEIQIPD
jgi:hypothetical protein